MFCAKCGSRVEENKKFCHICGAPIGQNRQETPQGQSMPIGQNRQEMQQGQFVPPQQMSHVPQKKSKKGPVIATIVCAVLVLGAAGGGIFWYFSVWDHQEREAHTTEIVEAIKDEKPAGGIQDTETSGGRPDETKQPDVNDTDRPADGQINGAEDGSASGDKTEDEQPAQQTGMTEEDYDALCKELAEIPALDAPADETAMQEIGSIAVMLEYAKDGKGRKKKCFSELKADEEKILIEEALQMWTWMSSYSNLPVWMTSGEAHYIVKDNATKFLEDMFGYTKKDAWTKDKAYQVSGDKVLYEYGDGDPWYYFYRADYHEGDDYYLMEMPVFYGDNGGLIYLAGYASYLFQKNENPFGVTLVYGTWKNSKGKNPAKSASATSRLGDQAGKNYKPDNVCDGKYDTVWVEGVDGVGIGESITVKLDKKRKVHGIMVANGYLSTRHLYQVNGKVTRATVTTGDGKSTASDFYINAEEDNQSKMDKYDRSIHTQVINLSKTAYTDTVTLTIEDAVGGSKYEDTCISEIIVY